MNAPPECPDQGTELAAAVRARVLPPDPSPEAVALARHIVDMAGDSVAGIVFFGSRKSRARPDPSSAFDLFVVIEPARAFYERLAAHGSVRRAPATLAALQAVLPPNQISLAAGAADGAPRAKCAVVTADDLRRQTSPRRDDHFCLGRLFQPTEILYAAPGREAEIIAALVQAHAFTYEWGRPWLPARFDVGEYCRTLLRVSFAAEIRPEPEGRAQALFDAQDAYLRPVYATLLAALAASGELREEAPGVYALVRPVGAFERLRLAAYFRWSKVRATVRWAKYVITFDDWLDFIVRKARRHTGEDIVLSDRERRMPLLFLWPRVIHYLRHKDRARE
jgi:hypothetical protein